MSSAPTNSDTNSSSDGVGEISTGVSFSNEVEAQQADKTPTDLKSAKGRVSLSQSAKAWDLDGDGELDDAELALKNLDKSHKGKKLCGLLLLRLMCVLLRYDSLI